MAGSLHTAMPCIPATHGQSCAQRDDGAMACRTDQAWQEVAIVPRCVCVCVCVGVLEETLGILVLPIPRYQMPHYYSRMLMNLATS